MKNEKMKISFVIATKDRPKDLEKLLKSISEQTAIIHQVVIVDSSQKPAEQIKSKFPGINTTYIHHLPPSASKQRNIGVKAIDQKTDLVGFLDDDIVFEKDAIEQMLNFWTGADHKVAGASFNLLNPDKPGGKIFKRSRISDYLGIYTRRYGGVAKSGWQVAVETVPKTCYVEWIPTTAAVWRREIFDNYGIDEFFSGYSYLEDLDFSYQVSKKFRIAVVANAKFYHYHSALSRISLYQFGIIETRNRLYFVKKNKLSLPKFYVVISLRILMNLLGYFKTFNTERLLRVVGNIRGFEKRKS